MINQVFGGNGVQDDDERADLKQDIHQSLSQKKIQDEFDNDLQILSKSVDGITLRIINLQRKLNKRNNNIVSEVSKIIHHVLHETNEVADEISTLKDTTKKYD
jgi:hypothetical protein